MWAVLHWAKHLPASLRCSFWPKTEGPLSRRQPPAEKVCCACFRTALPSVDLCRLPRNGLVTRCPSPLRQRMLVRSSAATPRASMAMPGFATNTRNSARLRNFAWRATLPLLTRLSLMWMLRCSTQWRTRQRNPSDTCVLFVQGSDSEQKGLGVALVQRHSSGVAARM